MKPKGNIMVKTKTEMIHDKPDAFDAVVKKKAGRPKKVVAPPPPAPADEDSEEMSEAEAQHMVERQAQRKEEHKSKLEQSVDTQDWTLSEPVIPPELQGRIWVAVYRCPDGHKTKATNRQSQDGIFCYAHRMLGQKVKADIMPQFLAKPDVLDPDLEKRKKARKGAE